MSIQEKVRTAAAALDLAITQQQMNHLVSTLRYSRVRTASNLDPLIHKELTRLIDKVKQELPTVETTAQTASAEAATFKQIDASLAHGACPRCGKKMRDVLLADYNTHALFCEGECRITLWAQDQQA